MKCPRAIIPQVSVRIRCRLNHPEFFLLSPAVAEGSTFTNKIKIIDCFMQVRRILPHSSIADSVTSNWDKGNPFLYPFFNFETITYSLTSGTQTSISPILMYKIPSFLVIGLLDSKSFHGETTSDPTAFYHHGLEYASVLVDGATYMVHTPQKIEVTDDGKDDTWIQTYRNLLTLGKCFDSNITISPSEFLKYGSFYIPLIFDFNNQNRFQLSERTGNVQIQLKFKKDLAKNLNVICFFGANRVIQIDKNNVFIN